MACGEKMIFANLFGPSTLIHTLLPLILPSFYRVFQPTEAACCFGFFVEIGMFGLLLWLCHKRHALNSLSRPLQDVESFIAVRRMWAGAGCGESHGPPPHRIGPGLSRGLRGVESVDDDDDDGDGSLSVLCAFVIVKRLSESTECCMLPLLLSFALSLSLFSVTFSKIINNCCCCSSCCYCCCCCRDTNTHLKIVRRCRRLRHRS